MPAKFADVNYFSYLCIAFVNMSKYIEYIAPISSIRGNISGRQYIRYTDNEVRGYDVPSAEYTPAVNYQPRMIARVASNGRAYYSVRTRTAVHLSTAARLNLAVLGGAGAIFSALRERGDCVTRNRDFPTLMQMLRSKAQRAQVAGITVDNPWQVAEPNVQIDADIVSKFNSILS